MPDDDIRSVAQRNVDSDVDTDIDAGADADLDAEYGFEPAVSATGRDTAASTAEQADGPHRVVRRRVSRLVRRPVRPVAKPRSAVRRRVGAVAIMLGSLASMGGIYAALAGSSDADASSAAANAESIAAGRNIYQVSCITCHGANLQGVNGQGPALIGVGSAAVYFQVSTGRMPAVLQGAYEPRKEAKFDTKQTDQLGAYIQSIGGGPAVPGGKLRGNDKSIADGGAMFRLNCASCHGTTFKGAPLSAGKVAPSLNDATDKQIYAAMLSGPESMPVFSNNQITPTEKRAIIAYIQTIKASKDPGGSGIDRIGPVSEAIVIWAVGVGALMIAILWIGARVR
ncbi:c-type cytochrome [uncultured Jatrophihabitans sp.]|uniref:cytochrome bc1 complex diheme cytochrome c subunit n=1 Tax=uncultured Jatrophihabitans sp. TaxID=1610747 RepID=UPI0035CBCE30